MSEEPAHTVRSLARVLSDIGHALESGDGADERIHRVLELVGALVPYRRCTLLFSAASGTQDLFVVPDASPDERAAVRAALARVLAMVESAEEVGRSETQPNLTLPIIGLDEVIGLIRLEPVGESTFDVEHVRLLSVVAAQLGAYLTMIRLREQDARHVADLTAAHDFQQLLVGVVSHDLRDPLTVIINVAERLREAARDEQDLVSAGRTLRSAGRAMAIINDLLDVTHARVTGKMTIARQPLDLRTILVNIVDDARLSHPGRTIELVAPPAPWTQGAWDPERLAQAVTNLLVNALGHGPKDAPVQVRLERTLEAVVVAVHNFGTAIPEALLLTLLDPFKRGGSLAREIGGGLGLGLYIVDQIAQGHRGRVTVYSSDTVGTTFRLELPLAEVRSLAPRPLRMDPPAPIEPPAAAVVLLVDDDVAVQQLTTDLLGQNGYQVVVASSGTQALELLHGGLRPGLTLLDLHMSEIDGRAFYDVCLADPELARIPILVVSSDAAGALEVTRGGAAGFVEKPLHAVTLLSAVATVFQSTGSAEPG